MLEYVYINRKPHEGECFLLTQVWQDMKKGFPNFQWRKYKRKVIKEFKNYAKKTGKIEIVTEHPKYLFRRSVS